MLLIVSGAFSFSLAIFGGMHTYLLFNNLTTIEYMEGSSRLLYSRSKNDNGKHVFNIGWKKNVNSVLGATWKEWILPIPTSRYEFKILI
jgi:palmitoyltransferase